MKKIAILYSGGLDSFIMHHMAHVYHPEAEIVSIYYDHGQPVAKREITGLPDFVEVRKITWLDEEKLPVTQPGRREGAIMIPGRNLVFGTLIACQELPDEVWIGALHGETHEKGTDKNYKFLKYMQDTVNYVVGPFRHHEEIKFRFPLADEKLNKLGEVQWALENGLTKADLLGTRSCHDGNSHACGQCIQCYKRWAVFGECGFEEEYDVHPLDSEFGKQFTFDIVNCELGNDDYYDETSRAEIMPYLVKYFKMNPGHFEPRLRKLLEELTSPVMQVRN